MKIAQILFFSLAVLFVSCEKEPDPVVPDVNPNCCFGYLAEGTTWVITRYDVVSTGNSFEPNDTLFFNSNIAYSINDSAERDFYIQKVSENDSYRLSLYDCFTLGGTYRGYILKTFIEDGEINNVKFWDLYSDSELHLWMHKI